ncbi:MAG: hypothetical protein Q7U40_14985, partial [Desulfatirhabdiaceae bacterium]|nr:hypothetical protein [Desulfatirhabdiaceae bacterium]
LSDILIHLGGLGLACQRIKEIDINPLIVFNGSPIAVDASIQLTTTEITLKNKKLPMLKGRLLGDE